MLVHYRFWCLLLVVTVILGAKGHQHNVTLPCISPQITYSPFLCDGSATIGSNQCRGAWKLSHLNDIAVISTDGPDPQTGGILPQMFVSFRASAAYLNMSFPSNATTNLTLSASGLTIFRQFNSSIRTVAVVDLIEDAITTLAVTFVPGPNYTMLVIDSVIITVANGIATSSFLPSVPLPSSSLAPARSLPTSTAGSQASQIHSKERRIRKQLGLGLGIGLGLPIVVGAAFLYWRRHKNSKLTEADRMFELVSG